MIKLTFKKGERSTGLAAIASPYADTAVKIKGKTIGEIHCPSRFGRDDWGVSILVRSEPGNACEWTRTKFKARFATEPEGRAWFIKNIGAIAEKYTLFHRED